MREGVYRRGSLSDRGFYWRVGEFSERGEGLLSKRWTYEKKREIFSKWSLFGREFVREAWDLLERGGLSDKGAYWRKRGGSLLERGGIFREREEIVGEGTLLLKNIIKGGIVRERGLFENLLYSQLQIEIYLFMIRNRSIKRIFTFLILFFSE